MQNMDYCRDMPLACQRYSLEINDIAKRCPYKINELVGSATSSSLHIYKVYSVGVERVAEMALSRAEASSVWAKRG